jgi:sulfur carrier protein
VNVTVNGQDRVLADRSTVADVVHGVSGDSGGRGIAVAVNGEVVSRSEWTARRLSERDRVEILRAVGGG